MQVVGKVIQGIGKNQSIWARNQIPIWKMEAKVGEGVKTVMDQDRRRYMDMVRIIDNGGRKNRVVNRSAI
jgi:hypothetical protein